MKTKVKIYDFGEDQFDRYTVAIIDKDWKSSVLPGTVPMLCISENPTWYAGFSQFTSGKLGKHLGKRIKFENLPKEAQKHVIQRLEENIVY